MNASHRPATGACIRIVLNGVPLGAVERVRTNSRREAREVRPIGATEAAAFVLGPPSHRVELTRLWLESLDEAPDFHALSGFTLEIVSPSRKAVYAGCEWLELEQSAEPDTALLEKAIIAARSRATLPIQ